jgi:hypothetical protein
VDADRITVQRIWKALSDGHFLDDATHRTKMRIAVVNRASGTLASWELVKTRDSSGSYQAFARLQALPLYTVTEERNSGRVVKYFTQRIVADAAAALLIGLQALILHAYTSSRRLRAINSLVSAALLVSAGLLQARYWRVTDRVRRFDTAYRDMEGYVSTTRAYNNPDSPARMLLPAKQLLDVDDVSSVSDDMQSAAEEPGSLNRTCTEERTQQALYISAQAYGMPIWEMPDDNTAIDLYSTMLVGSHSP